MSVGVSKIQRDSRERLRVFRQWLKLAREASLGLSLTELNGVSKTRTQRFFSDLKRKVSGKNMAGSQLMKGV